MNIIERLAFDMDDHTLVVRYSMTTAVEMTGLLIWPFSSEGERQRFPVSASSDPEFMYEAIVDLREVVAAWPVGGENLSVGIENISPTGEVIWRRLGQAPVTMRPWRTLQGVVDGVHVRLSVGGGGNLLLDLLAEAPRPRILTTTQVFRARGTTYEVALQLQSEKPVGDAEIVLTERRTGQAVSLPLRITRDEVAVGEQHGRHLVHLLEGAVDMTAITAALPADAEYISIHVTLDAGTEEERRVHLHLPQEHPRRGLQPLDVSHVRGTAHYVPYLTFKGQVISLKVEQFQPQAYETMQRMLRWAWLMPLRRRWAGVWLIGELPDRAQDNGYHFFRWVREQHPDRRAYYVISADSPQRDRLEQLGNVVVRGSAEHVRYALLATRLISTHLPEYLLPTMDQRLVRHVDAIRVFLQHGIMGMKNMVANYGRRKSDFHCDIFHVSSEREREMIINDFNYRPSQVRVTGLPRFDALLAPAAEEPRGLLIIPTWREWLVRPEFFLESDFVARWRELLHDPRIRAMVDAGERVTFMLHPNLTHHTGALDVPEGVTVLRQGDRDVQDLMREHSAMVTDYSSVGFDFALQGRPVYYFQFDRERFLGRYPSHIDPVRDLPGYVTADLDDLLGELERGWRAGFPMPPENAARIARAVDFPDRSNNERVYGSVKDSGGLRAVATRARTSTLAGRVFGRFRRSSRVYPRAMAAMMALARMMPRSNTIVFESGNGTQYAGNPRSIYEELVRRETGLRTVWISRSTFRPADITTLKVPRRSPRYFWELGRARYWVADQNLGLDIKPSRRTYYLQSWHGTPLKRMQHDALSHGGRDEGYLERVTRQMRTWTGLLSPSPYASEKFRSAFQFTGEMLELGYPRNDVLAGAGLEERAALTRARLGLGSDVRIVLFAPTFRDNVREHGRFVFRPGLDFTALAEQLPDDAVFLVRAHHVTRKANRVPAGLEGRVIDVTDYEDSHDLLAAADALITDYSSTMFDFALTGRPMLFFCPDLEEYGEQLRGFYFDFAAQAPGPILRSQDELVGALHDLDGVGERYREKSAAFKAQFGPLDDGHAAARVVDELLRR